MMSVVVVMGQGDPRPGQLVYARAVWTYFKNVKWISMQTDPQKHSILFSFYRVSYSFGYVVVFYSQIQR